MVMTAENHAETPWGLALNSCDTSVCLLSFLPAKPPGVTQAGCRLQAQQQRTEVKESRSNKGSRKHYRRRRTDTPFFCSNCVRTVGGTGCCYRSPDGDVITPRSGSVTHGHALWSPLEVLLVFLQPSFLLLLFLLPPTLWDLIVTGSRGTSVGMSCSFSLV